MTHVDKNYPNDQREKYHKGDQFNVSKKIKGIIKFVIFNKILNETQLRIVVK